MTTRTYKVAPWQRLSDDDRTEALWRLRAGDTQASIARDFGVTKTTIYDPAQRYPAAFFQQDGAGFPCEKPEMAASAPRSVPAQHETQRTDQGDAAALLWSLPDDGVVSDRQAGAIRLSQITSERLT